jgi:hypothetical protein
LKTAELFSPATGTFQKLPGEMVEPRGELAYAGLPSGKVLIAGGFAFTPKEHSLKTAELFDPETNSFSKLASEMVTARDGPAAALLPNGKVLIVGGEAVPGKILKSAELFDPATNAFEKLGPESIVGRYQPVAVALPNGRVLIAGGTAEGSVAQKSAELFNPETNTFEALTGPTHEMTEARQELTAAPLQNGRVLLLGGSSAGKGLTTAELFDFETNAFEKLAPELTEPREGPAVALLSDGRLLIVGGYNPNVEPLASRYLKTAELASVAPPSGTTTAASTVSTTTATLNGTALTEAVGTVYFQYGPSTAYGSATPGQAVSASILQRPVSAVVGGLAPGATYHFRIVAENAGGASYGADQMFTTAAIPTIKKQHPPGPTLAVTNVSQSHTVWRLGRALARIARRLPVGTRFSFVLTQPARVSFRFAQQVAGRKVNRKCVAQTRSNRRNRVCTRTVTRGTLAFTGHAGRNRVSFQGRISRSNKLKPGTYTLVITATNAGGLRAGPKQLTFTIVR